MKANRSNILKNDTGDVGIGTLIIFIAMVLVAAVAAAVLIQTSGVLQQKAQQTGKEATTEVSSNMKITSVVGQRTVGNATAPLTTLKVTVELAAGGSDVDFQQVLVRYLNETQTTTLHFNATSNTSTDSLLPNATRFGYSEERDPTSTLYVLSAGDLVILELDLSAMAQSLDMRKRGTVQIIPESGTMVIKDIVAPATYGTKTKIQLFP